MNRIRILHIIPNLGEGGAERLVANLLAYSDQIRFKPTVLSMYQESGTIIEREIKKSGYDAIFLDKKIGPDLRMISKVDRVLRIFKPDVVHTHRYVQRYSLLPTIANRIPARVHTVHSLARFEVDGVGRLIHWGAFRYGKVVPVCISAAVAESVRDAYGCAIETPVIYNGVDTKHFVTASRGKSEDSKKNDVILLHIGRFAPEKNHALLIKAFSQVASECPKIQLWLVGDGELREEVQRTVSRLALHHKVFFLGIRADVADLLAKCDILVLSSDYEGLGLAVIEAMAAARPVVGTAVGGIPEIVEDDVTGILVPPRDSNALARAILRLVRHRGIRSQMGKEGQKRALLRFDISRTAREYEALYINLLKQRHNL